MSFDHSASLDITSADMRCFRATKNRAPEGHVPGTRPVSFLMCSKFKRNPLLKLNTRLIGKELTMVSVDILFLFLKPDIKL